MGEATGTEKFAVKMQENADKFLDSLTNFDESYKKLSSGQRKTHTGMVLSFKIHASVWFSISAMLLAINVFLIFTGKGRGLWSFFAIIPWLGVLLMQFFITYSVFTSLGIPTRELDRFVVLAYTVIDLYIQPAIEKMRNFDVQKSPFPKNSKMAVVYNFLFKGDSR